MITDEDFMKELDRDYPNQDWDNVPDPQTLPNVYKISGKTQIVVRILSTGITTKIQEHFQIATEFPSREAAEEFIKERTMIWSSVFFKDESLSWGKRLTWTGTRLMDSIVIEQRKPEDACVLATVADFRKQILSGKKVFPLSLP
jgi:hypothetical protein